MSDAASTDEAPSPHGAELAALPVRLLHPEARVPARSRPHDAAMDLTAVEALTVPAGERRTVSTGVAIAMPFGVAGLIVPRSGLASKHGITALNGPGLIDPNFRGEMQVILHNAGDEPFEVSVGDRVAQLLLVPFMAPELELVHELPPSGDDRGDQGLGSSGR